jgi:solute:Na+ symporter, SSS family
MQGKLTIFHFGLNLVETYTFWAGAIGGCFLTMASHGTDQLMVQRLLAAKDLRSSRAALMTSGLVIAVQFSLFLLIGTGLYVFYRLPGSGAPPTSADRIFPTFIIEHMPHGISGLLVAAILAAAMSNLSAAVNSLSSSSIVDFYLRWRPESSERIRALASRWLTLFWTVVLFALALLSRGGGHVVETGLSIASVAYGSLLGVFLLGTLTRSATEAGAMIGMICGLVANLLLWKQPHALVFRIGAIGWTLPKVAWTWFVLIGSALTFLVGWVASQFLAMRRPAGLTVH